MLKAAVEEIPSGAGEAIVGLSVEQVEKVLQMVIEAQNGKIFVVGMGRSGFVGRSLALRPVNLGLACFRRDHNVCSWGKRFGNRLLRHMYDKVGDDRRYCGQMWVQGL